MGMISVMGYRIVLHTLCGEGRDRDNVAGLPMQGITILKRRTYSKNLDDGDVAKDRSSTYVDSARRMPITWSWNQAFTCLVQLISTIRDGRAGSALNLMICMIFPIGLEEYRDTPSR